MAKTLQFQGFDTLAQESYYFKMVDRTIKLLVDQLVVFLAGLPQQKDSFAQWTTKMRKSLKALRIMEVHKQLEPKFARTLKLLNPHIGRQNLEVSSDRNSATAQ